MNLTSRQPAVLGIALIVLGLVVWLNLWWMIVPGALIAVGVLGYQQRRKLGNVAEAVQVGLWCFGFAALYLTGFWIGILFLAGASLLLRGREQTIDIAVQQALQPRARRASPPVQQVPINQQPASTPNVTIYEAPNTNETTRL